MRLVIITILNLIANNNNIIFFVLFMSRPVIWSIKWYILCMCDCWLFYIIIIIIIINNNKLMLLTYIEFLC